MTRACPLSPAELIVTLLTANGLTGREVAHMRGTSLPTVEAQVQRAMGKVGAANRAHLVAICLREGWIE